MNELVQVLLEVGKILSAVSVVVMGATLYSLWRRESVPGFSYGGVALSSRRIRWVWTGVLIGATALGAAEDPIARVTRTAGGPDVTDTPGEGRQSTLTVPLPFYRYERDRTYRNGQLTEEFVLEGFVIPWPFLTALLAYFFLVARWNPENRWALRLLRGRRPAEVPDPEK